MSPVSSVQAVLDRRAAAVPQERLARAFLERNRWTGDEPCLLLAEAAAATTGQRFRAGIKPAVERFRESFVESGRIDSVADLAELDLEDDDLVAAFGAQRKRHVLLEAATVLADRPEDDDITALEGWAAEADHYRYDEDPIGDISGVGPATFQYLRQLAGVDVVRPDPNVVAFLEDVDEALDSSPIETTEPRRTIASCEWLSLVSTYRMLEIDRIAWWQGTDGDERGAILAAQGSTVEGDESRNGNENGTQVNGSNSPADTGIGTDLED
ncbi:hypothetical protein [Halobiforma nitratireducens]|uniref:HhH-GPD family protein n=1 Tax=Halobiforma nitratireducens JCM 10879 TaxID=1227454 RepID=M0M7I8_9EURY|nr:hypothetical protein [Halobiforma nitratireducens]EMA41782.1 hypothetical protein C446_05685 [Halobiforma nitratireducens JCM 10879]